jgi:KDO2-lipid IV(A) lauroyltransferase
VEQFAFGLVRGLARATPAPAFLAAGRLLGRSAFVLDRRHRRIALENLALAFPERTPAERLRLARACFSFFGRFAFDLVRSIPRVPEARLARFECEGIEHARAAYAQGHGVLFFTGHFGGWEFMAIHHARQLEPGALLARRLDNPHLEALLLALRGCTGNVVIEKRDGFRPTLRALRDGKGIAILIDQNVSGEDRVFVDYFGRPASTTPALALLHLKTQAPIVPVFAFPLAGDAYRLVYGPPVEVERTGDRRQDVRRITARCTAVLEEQVRAHPELWLWMHRRWKTEPGPGELE